MNLPAQADDFLAVTMQSITILEKTGSNQLTISYNQTNNTVDKKLEEGSFSLFFADGTGKPQYGSFGYFFPTDSRNRTYTWEYLKSQNPIVISYNPGFFGQSSNISKLNWAIPGKTCLISILADKAAADKAAADKAAADAKAIADKAAADAKAIADKAAADAKAIADKAAAVANRKEQTIIASPLTIGSIPISSTGLSTQVKSTSNLPVFTYNNTNDVCVYENGMIKTKTSGRCVIAFSQEGDSEFKPASNLILDFIITTADKKTTITCIKGKLVKKVTAVKPKCPGGYKVKK